LSAFYRVKTTWEYLEQGPLSRFAILRGTREHLGAASSTVLSEIGANPATHRRNETDPGVCSWG